MFHLPPSLARRRGGAVIEHERHEIRQVQNISNPDRPPGPNIDLITPRYPTRNLDKMSIFRTL